VITHYYQWLSVRYSIYPFTCRVFSRSNGHRKKQFLRERSHICRCIFLVESAEFFF